MVKANKSNARAENILNLIRITRLIKQALKSNMHDDKTHSSIGLCTR